MDYAFSRIRQKESEKRHEQKRERSREKESNTEREGTRTILYLIKVNDELVCVTECGFIILNRSRLTSLTSLASVQCMKRVSQHW